MGVSQNRCLIGMLPGNKSVAVTVLARPDTLDYMNTNVRDAYPDIFYDPIVYDSLTEMQAAVEDAKQKIIDGEIEVVADYTNDSCPMLEF